MILISRLELFFSFLLTAKFSESFVITCSFKNSDVGFGHFDTCEPSLFDTSNDKFIDSVLMWPIDSKTDQIKQFYVEHQNAVYFPGNLHVNFPNLEAVHFWNSRMKFIESFDLRRLTKLKYLRLEDNDIEVLQSNIFVQNLQLLEIHLSNNKLKFVAAKILVPLTMLKRASFKNNICIDENADTTSGLKSLGRNLEEQCSSPEFLAKKNLELIRKVVDFNYTITDLNSSNAKLLSEVKTRNKTLATCEDENEDLNDIKSKLEIKLSRESSALKKLQKAITICKGSNDELTIENVKLNNELKRAAQKITEAETRTEEIMFSNSSSTQNCSGGSSDIHRLNFENIKLIKDNQQLKSFKDEIEKEWRSVILRCQFSIWDGYACQTNSLKIQTDESEIAKVDGKHEGRKTNFDVKSFIISSQDVRTTFLPINIGSVFPKLLHLIAQNSKLVFIKRGNFDDLRDLKTLLLDHNQITEIPSDTFNDVENLIKLDLASNRITKLKKETFGMLKKLQFLAFNDNQIEKLSANMFKSNTKLEVISMENNKIKYLSSSMLSHLTKLKIANLNHNTCINERFTEVTVRQFEAIVMSHCTPPTDVYCKFVITEDFYRCQVVDLMTEFENTMVQEVQGTHQRGKSNNDVTELSIVEQSSFLHFPTGFGNFLKNLKKVSVSKSQLLTIEENSFDTMNIVAQLFLAGNEISSVSEEAFQNLKSSLEVIDLSNNKIVHIDTKTFKNLMKLKVLKLSGNIIESLNSNLLTDNLNIEELDMSKNKLKSIGAYLMNNMRSLKTVDFTSNSCINQKFPQTTLEALKLKILELCK